MARGNRRGYIGRGKGGQSEGDETHTEREDVCEEESPLERTEKRSRDVQTGVKLGRNRVGATKILEVSVARIAAPILTTYCQQLQDASSGGIRRWHKTQTGFSFFGAPPYIV
jgi:hypothetical protein